MILNNLKITGSGKILVSSVPDGLNALVVAEIATEHLRSPVIHISPDDSHMLAMEEALGFFAPDLSVLKFPAWDCLPYDRVSPRSDILGTRIEALSRLTAIGSGPLVLVTTVNAFLQRVPTPGTFRNTHFSVKSGTPLDQDGLTRFLVSNGYNRTGTVREPGEYAIRGGIIDIFPSDRDMPLRLDLFGDEIEEIREFDPLSQTGKQLVETFSLHSINEFSLNPDGIERFRSGFRELFGNVADDPIYEAVSAGQKIAGIEHWLPLFHEELAVLTDYLPEAPVITAFGIEDAIEARFETIADFYQARLDWLGSAAAKKIDQTPVYRPLPPDRLYMTETELTGLLSSRLQCALTPFSMPEGSGDGLFGQVIDAEGRRSVRFADQTGKTPANQATDSGTVFDDVIKAVKNHLSAGRKVTISAYSNGSRDRLSGLLREHGLGGQKLAESWADVLSAPKETTSLICLGIENGFITRDYAVFSEQDILGDRLIRQTARRKKAEDFLSDIAELTPGDIVVHLEHGVGRYDGLETIMAAGAPHDCLRVLYYNDDKLFVPVENIETLSRFGSGDAVVNLDRLGGAAWQARKAKLKDRLRDMADELIRIAAARTMRPGRKLEIDPLVMSGFAARFPWQETPDQEQSIEATLADLASGQPMDRLVCGDVGFGKTEIALRAAFTTVMAGGQVAVIAPTTLLCRQHFESFVERFHGYPVVIKQLSRFVSQKEAALTREGIANGTVDIVIGTHALLGKSVKFDDLALLVIDEEQHFGVAHKERLKQLRADVHILTLSATPIPRTLQMALTGVKDMSIIATPPVDRLSVRTFIMPFDPVTLREAILRERFRGGQVFYVCPRISDMDDVAAQVREMVPDIKIAMAHGQMPPSELEEVMAEFYDARVDMLLSTQIVESGLDIPNANTLIIHRADMFGLAQLYQLRGRIGRSKIRGYCYLTLPPRGSPTPAAIKRLEVMQSLDSLGAGFTLASHDLDIRGAGNLLGEEQSGHIREVGVELYQQMLEEAVAEAKGTEPEGETGWVPTISLGTPVLIPDSYVSDLNSRLSLYRRASALETEQEIEAFAAELIDRFGAIPAEVENLLQIIAIKQLCRRAGVEKLDAGPKGAVIRFRNDSFADPVRLIGYIQQHPREMSVRPDQQLVVRRDWPGEETRLKGVRKLVGSLADLAE